MPRAKTRTASGLSIELDNSAPFYHFGSTIAGNVTFNTASDVAIGVVSVRLYGRSKVHYVQHHGQGESHWRGRAPLFSRSLILYEGKHTHKPGSWVWPFEFTIPTRPDADALREKRYTWKARSHYLSTETDVSHHTLPPTFNYAKWGFGYRFHAYTEYVLEVNFSEPEGTHHVIGPSTKKTVLPLKVLRPAPSVLCSTPLPGIQFSIPPGLPEKSPSTERIPDLQQTLISQSTTHTVRSLKLKTENRYESLTIRQRASSLFNTNDLPAFTFTATVSRPDKVRLLNQASLPFLVSVCPIANGAQTTISRDEYPDVRIETLTLSLRATTYIRFRCMGILRHENTSYDINLLDRYPVRQSIVLNHEDDDIVGSRKQSNGVTHTSSEAINKSIDLSNLPGLGVCFAAAKLGKNVESPLTTSFNSYIISREYELRWKLELDVVGQKVKVEGDGDKGIVLLDAEKEQIMQFLSGAQSSTSSLAPDEEADSDSDEEEAENDDEKGRRLVKGMSQLLSARRKKSKAEEAAEENENAQIQNAEVRDELPRYEAEGEPGTVRDALPKYES